MKTNAELCLWLRHGSGSSCSVMMGQAADAIERLESECDDARKALNEVLDGLEDLCASIGHKSPKQFADFQAWRTIARGEK